MKLRWDQRALGDLRDIRNYISAHSSPASAERVRAYLVGRVDRLRAHTRLGTASSDAEIRILAPTRYPYRIYYTVQRGEVVILHVRHTARQAPPDLQP